MGLELAVIPRTTFAPLPWKNGGGMTFEAIRVPPTGDPFSWRVSLAQIDSSGPFSDFTGYDRNMVLLRGRGIALKFEGGEHRTLRKVGDWLQFDGGMPVHCELLDGPCTDLNLMVSKSMRAAARLERLGGNLQLDAGHGQITLIFSLEDALSIDAVDGDGERVRLEPWDLAVLSQGSARLNRIASDKPAASAVFIASISQ
jgi:environmental stress-induced protein Ves